MNCCCSPLGPGASGVAAGFALQLTTLDTNTWTSTSVLWQAIPPKVNQFGNALGSGFTFDPDTGIMTYTGTARLYLLQAQADFRKTNPLQVVGAWSHNNDVALGTSNIYAWETGYDRTDSTTGGRDPLQVMRVVNLSPGDTVQLVARDADTAANGMFLHTLNIALTPFS